MGCKVQSQRRAVRASDVDDVRVHVPVRQACSLCVFVSAALLEGLNRDACSSLCP